ncbi:MAG TPA: aconitate hydratase [Candidatus Pullichristensenella excrementigallinarum]|uniref:Aconitate hydratase n=1 Tax=Candidatus Pullichristensenella excrementigallinarum TaxID=2840907 RepID=A0A9D1LAV4_9FIRM|nr:aconitate hydratase [Candidatus Pullichristensenella excrementigallinarum]
MPYTLAQKLIASHLVSGEMVAGTQIGLKIDQTLTQDATGTMAYLALEAMNIDRVRTELSVAYVDHNTLQCGFENADDHRYLQTVACKYGVRFSRPGNGICHQVHLERYAKPGKTLIGSDSHTPTAGALGMLAMGAGGMDVAVAMAGGAYYIAMPRVFKVELTGKLSPWVSAKDVSLELLRRLSVRGGRGAVVEWGGEGLKTLSVPERATIANMSTEIGATASIFPADAVAEAFLRAQGRAEDFVPLESDADAEYDRVIQIDLSSLEPLAACPHSPDNVRPVRELKDVKVSQVCIGSCTNSSLRDLLRVASILKGRTISPEVSLSVSPGSRQVLSMLTSCGALTDILSSGARVLECACGPCIGMGFSPASGGVSARTFNRNFEGRSGTRDAQVYLVSPETAAATALFGRFTDPRELGEEPPIQLPGHFLADDSGVLLPASPEKAASVRVERGPNILPMPLGVPMEDSIEARVALKVGDNITTDHIMPAGAKILPYRSNVPKLSEFCFTVCDEEFPARAKALGQSIVVGGANYGQGSSREHAALVPMYLGVRAIVAKSFARIHAANLINYGILPLAFENADDYDRISQGDLLGLKGLFSSLETGRFTLQDRTTGESFTLTCALSDRQRDILRAGGLLRYTKEVGTR